MRRSFSPACRASGATPRGLDRGTLVLIDEAHLVPHDGDGMYRSLLAELRALVPPGDMRVAGFSATPFRLDSGRLDEGEGKIFDDVVFDYGIGQGIRDGWLSPLTSKATGAEINISGVGRAAANSSSASSSALPMTML